MTTILRTFLAFGLASWLSALSLATMADEFGLPSTESIEIATISGEVVTVSLPLNKARVVRLPVDVSDVVATNEAIVDVIVGSPRQLYLLGKAVGSSNLLLLDGNGNEIARLDVNVGLDLGALEGVLMQLMPDESIQALSVNDNLVLSGNVSSPQVATNVIALATRFVPAENIVNLLSVRNEQQVLLKVRFAEVSRDAVKDLGIDASYIVNTSDFTFGIASLSGLAAGAIAGGADFATTGSNPLDIAITALERNSLLRILAEPSVTAISGEEASVLVGGEFPIPVAGGPDGQITVEFRQFGVVLGFVPIVLTEGRISLQINAEVSAISRENSVTVSGFNIPGLTVRRTSTSIDLPSGGTLVIAGLLQNNITSQIEGTPGLVDIPILGALFRSTRFQRQETELIVTVTPYLVRPIALSAAAAPTDGYIPPSDIDRYLFGKLFTPYAGRVRTEESDQAIFSAFGFIVE